MTIHHSAKIHPTALIDGQAVVEEACEIGAYSIVGANVHLSKNVKVKNFVVLESNTFVGENTIIDNHSTIGSVPIDYSYNESDNYLIIGKNCIFYNLVTINAGKNYTKIGDNCIFMGQTGIGHDCVVGDNVVLSPSVIICGHCVIESDCNLGCDSSLHQHVRMGRGSMLGIGSVSSKDIIPYSLCVGVPAKIVGCNLVGMKRKNIDKKIILTLNKIYKKTSNIIGDLQCLNIPHNDVYSYILEFIGCPSKRNFLI